jgi:hypothetical protein
MVYIEDEIYDLIVTNHKGFIRNLEGYFSEGEWYEVITNNEITGTIKVKGE